MNNYTFQLMAMKSSACVRHKVQTWFHYIYKYLLDHLQYLTYKSNVYTFDIKARIYFGIIYTLQMLDTTNTTQFNYFQLMAMKVSDCKSFLTFESNLCEPSLMLAG